MSFLLSLINELLMTCTLLSLNVGSFVNAMEAKMEKYEEKSTARDGKKIMPRGDDFLFVEFPHLWKNPFNFLTS